MQYQPIELHEYETTEFLSLNEHDKKICERIAKYNWWEIKNSINGKIQISATSYVGSVQLSDYIINIIPKLNKNTEQSVKNYIRLIGYAYEIDELKTNDVGGFELEKNTLLDLLILSFINKCDKLIKAGILKTYVYHQDARKFLKGKLIIKKQLIHMMKKQIQFTCGFNDLEYDNLENQIILSALKYSYKTTKSKILKTKLQYLIEQFIGDITSIEIKNDNFNNLNFTSYNKHYKEILKLCKFITNSTGLGVFGDKFLTNAFFVNMDTVFEKFMVKLFKKCYPKWHIDSQKTQTVEVIKKHKLNMIIKPDINLYDTNNRHKIIDLKYKQTENEDVYQMAFYIHEYNHNMGFLITPKHLDITDKLELKNQNVTIHINTIDLDHVLDLWYEGKNKDLKKYVLELVNEI